MKEQQEKKEGKEDKFMMHISKNRLKTIRKFHLTAIVKRTIIYDKKIW